VKNLKGDCPGVPSRLKQDKGKIATFEQAETIKY